MTRFTHVFHFTSSSSINLERKREKPKSFHHALSEYGFSELWKLGWAVLTVQSTAFSMTAQPWFSISCFHTSALLCSSLTFECFPSPQQNFPNYLLCPLLAAPAFAGTQTPPPSHQGLGYSPRISRNTGGFCPSGRAQRGRDLHVLKITFVIFQNAESQSRAPPGHWHSVCQAVRQTAQVLNGFTSFMLRTLELTMELDKRKYLPVYLSNWFSWNSMLFFHRVLQLRQTFVPTHKFYLEVFIPLL